MLVDFKDGADMRVIQSGSGLGFAFETAARGKMAGVVSPDELNGDFAKELLILGDIDFAHSAGTEWRKIL